MRKKIDKEWLVKLGTTILSLFLFCCIWAALVAWTDVGRALPGPVETFKSFFQHFVVKYGPGRCRCIFSPA